MLRLVATGLLFIAGLAALFKFAFGLSVAESIVITVMWLAAALCLGVLIGHGMEFGLRENPPPPLLLPDGRSLHYGA